jgi:hypothetical protein
LPVSIYSLPKTLADYFKFCNKIGLDVVLEELHECWREKRGSMDEIWYYTKIYRVHNVMHPYLESLKSHQISLLISLVPIQAK